MERRALATRAKVEAVNAANEHANKLYAELVKIFEPLVGQKILKADGTLLAKVQALLPEFPCTPSLMVYNVSDYSLAWTVKTNAMVGDSSCLYHETTVYIGELSNGNTLAKITPPQEHPTGYKAEDVEELRAKVKAAKERYENLKSKLFPFGEFFDN